MPTRKLIFILLPVVFTCLNACIPTGMKKEMDASMSAAQQIMADMEFKKAISLIELHKLRSGQYPDSLQQIQFLSAMDSSMFTYVNYKRLDTAYELNCHMEFPSFDDKGTVRIKLHYPAEFWKGLGCIKSNAR